jgi:hypothetical protein
MKNLKIVLATLLVATLAISVSSFTAKSYNKRAFSVQCYEITVVLSTSTLNTDPTPTSALNAWHDANGDGTFDTTNWTSKTQTQVTTDCSNTGSVCAICFDPGLSSYSLQNALDDVAAALQTNSVNFSNGGTYQKNSGTPIITFYEKP